MVKLLARYSNREKAIVALALLVLFALMLHAWVIEPYQLRMAALKDELQQQSNDLGWMRTAVSRLPAGGISQSPEKISGSVANFIDQTVRSQGLSAQLSQMTPVGEDEIRMRYSAVDFNRLIGFIALITASGLEVIDIRISSGDKPGLVDSSIVFSRS